MYDHRYTPTYMDCVQRYQHRSEILAVLSQALAELARQPFGNPRLQTHSVKKAQPDTFTSYVTNQGHRLIWRRVGNVIVLLLFGEHDAVYRRAERLRLEIDDTQNVLRVIDEDPRTGDQVPYAQRRADEGRLFMAWNDRELADFGFQPHEVAVLRRLNHDNELTSLDGHMRQEAWEMAMNLAIYGHPDGAQAVGAAGNDIGFGEPQEGEMAPAPVDARIVSALADRATSPEFIPVEADELAEVLARQIEDWMVYLDPSQEDLVRRTYNGRAADQGRGRDRQDGRGAAPRPWPSMATGACHDLRPRSPMAITPANAGGSANGSSGRKPTFAWTAGIGDPVQGDFS